MQSSFYYALKVWAAGILVSPFIFLIISELINPRIKYVEEVLLSILLLIVFGCLLSIPSFLIFGAISKALSKTNRHPLKIKLILSIAGILSTLLPFYLFGDPFRFDLDRQINVIQLCYGSVITAAIWIFKLPQRTEVNDELPIPTYPDFK